MAHKSSSDSILFLSTLVSDSRFEQFKKNCFDSFCLRIGIEILRESAVNFVRSHAQERFRLVDMRDLESGTEPDTLEKLFGQKPLTDSDLAKFADSIIFLVHQNEFLPLEKKNELHKFNRLA